MEIVTDVDKLNVDLQATLMKYSTIKQWAYPSGVDKRIKRIKNEQKTEGERMNYAKSKTNGDCHRCGQA